MQKKFQVGGMSCAACSAKVEKCVAKVDGVENVNVSLLTNSMVVDYDNQATSADAIIHAVEDAGYSAAIYTGRERSEKKEKEEKRMRTRLWISVAFWIPLMYVAMAHMLEEWIGLPVPKFLDSVLSGEENFLTMAIVQIVLLLPIIIVNFKYFTNGFKSLFHLSPNMDSLIATGATAAVVFGVYVVIAKLTGNSNYSAHELYFESAGTILTLITVGKYLEAKAKGKTGRALEALIALQPQTAIVERNGEQVKISADELEEGDIFVIKPGAAMPADGVVIEGEASVDESSVTGESVPVQKKEGDTVMTATINREGFLRVRATKVGLQTSLAQIIELVENVNSQKAPIARFADKVAGVFVPVVIGIAIVTVIVWLLVGQTVDFAVTMGMSVLVISCPCALGLATPVAIMVGTGNGAKAGILFKSSEALETMHHVNVILLDKTGTITHGKPEVTDVIPFEGYDEKNLVELIAAVESRSEHPFATAIVEYAKKREVPIGEASEFLSKSGRGVSGRVSGKVCMAGNASFMLENGIDTAAYNAQADALADDGKTPLFVCVDSQLAGIVAVADTVKEGAPEAIAEMKALGARTVMLTGDNQRTALAIKRIAHVDDVVAGVLPADKANYVEEQKKAGGCVAMVGDGINDAPALAAANVGIAIGAGTDIAMESADIILVKSDLRDVVSAAKLSKSVVRNIKENLFWAFFYNVLGIPVAAGVFYAAFGLKLNPMIAAAAMSFSSIFVVLNALRLRKKKFIGK